MQVQPVPIIARRMMGLLCAVAAVDAAVALFAQHPAVWYAMLPALIPLLTPVTIFFPRKRATN
jgi:hypothetical protein